MGKFITVTGGGKPQQYSNHTNSYTSPYKKQLQCVPECNSVPTYLHLTCWTLKLTSIHKNLLCQIQNNIIIVLRQEWLIAWGRVLRSAWLMEVYCYYRVEVFNARLVFVLSDTGRTEARVTSHSSLQKKRYWYFSCSTLLFSLLTYFPMHIV